MLELACRTIGAVLAPSSGLAGSETKCHHCRVQVKIFKRYEKKDVVDCASFESMVSFGEGGQMCLDHSKLDQYQSQKQSTRLKSNVERNMGMSKWRRSYEEANDVSST